MGLTAPAETTFEYERTQRFTLTGYLQNAGGFPAKDVVMKLTVPDGLTVLSGSALQDKQNLLAPGDTQEKSWVIAPTGKAGGNLKLTLSATSSNIEANQVERTINVIVPKPCFVFKPAQQRVQIDPDEPTPIICELNMSPAQEFYGFSVTLQFDPSVMALLDISRGRAFVDVEKDRRFSWSVDKKNVANGLITLTGRRIDTQDVAAPALTQAEVNLATLIFSTVKAGKTKLTFTNATLISTTGETRTVDKTDGEIEVVPTSAPATSAPATSAPVPGTPAPGAPAHGAPAHGTPAPGAPAPK